LNTETKRPPVPGGTKRPIFRVCDHPLQGLFAFKTDQPILSNRVSPMSTATKPINQARDAEKILRALFVRDRVMLARRDEANELRTLTPEGREAIRAARARQNTRTKLSTASPPAQPRRIENG
jgi:hypothetical protein